MRNITKTSIQLQKNLSVLETCDQGTSVTYRNIGDFSAIVANLQKVTISTAAIMPKKLEKFVSILTANGFKVTQEKSRSCGFEGKDAPCVAIQMEFSK